MGHSAPAVEGGKNPERGEDEPSFRGSTWAGAVSLIQVFLPSPITRTSYGGLRGASIFCVSSLFFSVVLLPQLTSPCPSPQTPGGQGSCLFWLGPRKPHFLILASAEGSNFVTLQSYQLACTNRPFMEYPQATKTYMDSQWDTFICRT